MTNLLISGLPQSGKTTLIKKILQVNSIGKKAGGFYTEEFRQKGARMGFNIVTVPEGRIGLLAEKGLRSPARVGRYGVHIKMLEELGCGAIIQALAMEHIVIVDEIGKMELFSEKFRTTLTDALNSPQKVIATIMERPNAFADQIKKRPDVRLYFLERKNFDDVFKEILYWLDKQWDFCL